MNQYLILKSGPAPEMHTHLWLDLGDVEAEYPQAAVDKVKEDHGAGEYMVIGAYGHDRFTVTERTEYVVEPAEPEQTAPEPFVPALEPPF